MRRYALICKIIRDILRMKTEADENLFQGQDQVWKYLYSYVDFKALKCAVELGIPDILHSKNRPLSLSEIASKISNAPSPNIPYLHRIMRLLAYNKIFSSVNSPESESKPESVLYGPSSASKWLVRESNELSLAPLLLMQNHAYLNNTWDQLSTCVREGGDAFPKANNGCEFWDLTARDPEFNVMVNEAMRCSGNITMDAIISLFDKNAWNGLESLVDVGGGNGHMIAGIAKNYPHIKGINFDLPHVIAAAPNHDGISNVSGDMFDAIPSADAVFMKRVLHNWDDESCVKILENCKKAIPEKTGKIFIADQVLSLEISDGIELAADLLMMAFTKGMQRTELQWKSVLEKGGFPRYKITQLPTLYSIIEAYPN